MKLLKLLILLFVGMNLYSQDFNYLPTSNGEVIKHNFYSLSYIEKYEQAEWVAYELTTCEANGIYERTNYFRKDSKISTESASYSDYKNTGYDRGHLAPAADMAFSPIAMEESFMYSNVSPQDPSFNRGIWRILESQVRTWARNLTSIYVITGGIFDSDEYIGENKVLVPSAFYKIILYYKNSNIKVIAFILKNKKGEKELKEYVVSVDEVEEKTNIDFFPELKDSLENEIEKNIKIENWKFN